ncbi:glycosyltransferase family 2 protein [Patescibacteria group bacterium]|nr:glycosyltransferase family 2 protein [Patescibacteria group bacterium]MBU1683249.1 glycosyltransferase family 2 protein [Patescibacteria group bacterium]MBU1934856.1 glycosyltransferase family 2 protein [Patescibacteria group bacterium]
MTVKASIIILDFKKSKRVCENVESILKQEADFPFEIIIIDNSCDGQNAEKLKTLEKYGNIQVNINETNIGYIKGNNLGAKLARGEYLLIVNPDIIWKDSDTLQKLIDFMDKNSNVGICGPKQINDGDDSTAMTVRAFPKFGLQVARRTFLRHLPIIKKWVAHDEMQHLDYDKVQDVDWLQSSFWVIRKDLWDSFGGLNSDYFIFMSDPDLCFKVWKKGYKVVYYPDVTVHADGIRCSEGGVFTYFQKWTLRQHVRDALRYWWNHLFKGSARKN